MKFLEKHKEIKEKFIEAFKELGENYKKALKKYDVVKLTNYDLFRLRIGKYRAIYTIINDEFIILVLNIDSRGDIYKSLKNKGKKT